MHQVDQRGGDHVGHVAHRSGDVVVLVGSHHEGDGAHGLHHAAEGFQLGVGGLRGPGEDVVGVFQQLGLGVGVTHALTAGHGVSSHEVRFKTQTADRIMDPALDAAHVGEDGGVLQERFHLLRVGRVVLHGRAQEDEVALGETRIDIRHQHVDHPVLVGLGQGFPVGVEGDYPVGSVVSLERTGDGSADEPESQEAEGVLCH